ncbi:MAG TPA: NAD(P)H-binding protein [Microlunatus sp.]|nr:NAD(P)H-binding protein [Microlunatus sp.]
MTDDPGSAAPAIPVRVAVTGAGGAIGSQVVQELAGTGRVEVTAVVRRPGAAPTGRLVREVIADYEDPAALVDALTGVQVLVFIGSDGEADRMLTHHDHIVDAVRTARVRRVVLLSSLDADPRSPFCYAHTYAVTERLLAGVDEPVFVRAGLYAEFFSRWVVGAAASGELRLPMADGWVAPVGRGDVARCLAGLALSDRVSGEPLVLTGPDGLTLTDLGAEASRLAGRPVSTVDCSAEEFARLLIEAQTEAWWTYAFSTMFAAIREGRFNVVTSGVADVTGRPATPFRTCLDAL